MKRLALCSLLLCSVGPALANPVKAPAPPVAYQTFVHGRVRYHMVVADMSAGTVSAGTMMATQLRPAWKMIGDKQPLAAITGTFFATRGGIPVADVLVDGDLVAKGDRGSGVGVDHFGSVTIFDERFKTPVDWGQYRYGLRGAVRIVSNGKVQPNPKAQRFRDRAIWGRAARTGLGLTKSGKLVLIATNRKVTLSQLGKAMVSRGVKNAIGLDGGSSTCLYYKGKMIVSPKRKLVNLFVLTPRTGSLVAAKAPAVVAPGAGRQVETLKQHRPVDEMPRR